MEFKLQNHIFRQAETFGQQLAYELGGLKSSQRE